MDKAKGLSADVYMTLDHYLDIVIPQIDRLPYTSTLTLAPGLNVMDLSAYTTELQSLVIRSVIEWVYEHGSNVLVIIPEAWEFIPQNRGSPGPARVRATDPQRRRREKFRVARQPGHCRRSQEHPAASRRLDSRRAARGAMR